MPNSATVAVVFGFSERCIALAEQFLLTLNRNLIPCVKENNLIFHIYAYKCNFAILEPEYEKHRFLSKIMPTTFGFQPFSDPDFTFQRIPLDNAVLHMKDCSSDEFQRHHPLPDIALYQDFVDKHVYGQEQRYDYLMFCHDDIAFFNKTQMIDQMIEILSRDRYNMVCRATLNCNEDISIRFHPEMIFTSTCQFEQSQLSFINNLQIMDRQNFKIFTDGGAGLLNSYYHNSNKVHQRPYTTLPDVWYSHIKAMGDTGVEFCYVLWKNRREFRSIITEAERYTDTILYGQNA